MPLPFQEELDKYKSMMEQLQAPKEPEVAPTQEPAMPAHIQDAIIGTESSGRADAIGDIGAKAGDSRGLMQIQDETARGLLKNGKLPKVWNGKKVKKKDLPQLLLDPEFNKQAGAALYEDNRQVLRRSAKRRGIELTPEQEQELLIKAHNQGMTKTLKRDLYGEEPLNPKVQQYLQKVKGRTTQEFANGGTVEPNMFYTPEEYEQEKQAEMLSQLPMGIGEFEQPQFEAPINTPVQELNAQVLDRPSGLPPAGASNLSDPYREMMKEYQAEKDRYNKQRETAIMTDLASGITNAFGQYGTKKAAAKAQQASGMQFNTPEYGVKNTNVLGGLKQPNLQEYMNKIKMMKELKALKNKEETAKDFTLGEGQIRYDSKGKVIATGPKKSSSQKGFTLGEGQVRYDQEGNVIAKGGEKAAKPVQTKVVKTVVNGIPVTKLVNSSTGDTIKEFETAPAKAGEVPLSTDPNSKESKDAQAKLKGIGFSIDDASLKKLSQNDIESNFGAFIRKTTRKIEQDREARLAEKQAWQVAEKDEVSDKQLESITAIDDIQHMVDRIVELKKNVKLNKGIMGPKARQMSTQLGAEWLGIEPDADYAKLQALVEKQLSDYIKSASGLTVSDQEATRLSRAIPSMAMPDGQFNAVMKEFQKTLKDVRNARFKNIKGYQGKFIPTDIVKQREGLIKKVKTQFPTWDRDKAIRYLKEKKRW